MKKSCLLLALFFSLGFIIVVSGTVGVLVFSGAYPPPWRYSEGGWIDIEIPEHLPPIARVDYTVTMRGAKSEYSIHGRKVHLVAGYLGKSGAKTVIETENKDDHFYRITMDLSKGNNWEQNTYRFIKSEAGQWQIEMRNIIGQTSKFPLDPFTEKIEKISVRTDIC